MFPTFNAFFHAVHEKPPFPWQERLATQLVKGAWPDTINLPTASGKTAILDCAIYALAAQADNNERTVPRRIAMVVDRRLVVDQTYRRACTLRDSLITSEKPEIMSVADRLRRLAGADDQRLAELAADEVITAWTAPLAVVQLRGGIPRDDAWATTPIQPAIIISTVDQVGSRLLFRGYGLSRGMRPIHSALLANDCAIIIDEAHCSRPFWQTADAISTYRTSCQEPSRTPFAVCALSATPGEDANGFRFALDDHDRAHPLLSQRLDNPKPTRLDIAGRNDYQLVKACVSHARDMLGRGRKRIAIIVNRVATARAIYTALAPKDVVSSKLHTAPDHRCDLMIGRMRPHDREQQARDIVSVYSVGADDGGTPAILVATQCIEVGADLDFDAMISEIASIDALRQRFGRLDRIGSRHANGETAEGIILTTENALKLDTKKPDPIYGSALPATWNWLSKHSDNEVIDFGNAALSMALDADPAIDCSRKTEDAPILLPGHIDALVQTSPEPDPSPDSALFLHGFQDRQEILICWRRDLPHPTSPQAHQRLAQLLVMLPPRSQECLSVPLRAFQSWLKDRQDLDMADAPMSESEEEVIQWPIEELGIARWHGSGSDRTGFIKSSRDINPGDTLVLPNSLEGHQELGHVLGPLDIADEILQDRPRPILRLTASNFSGKNNCDGTAWPDLLAQYLDTDIDTATRSALEWLFGFTGGDPSANPADGPRHAVRIADLFSSVPQDWQGASIQLHPGLLEDQPSEDGLSRSNGVILIARNLKTGSLSDTDEDTLDFDTPYLLSNHLTHVETLCHIFASKAGIDPPIGEIIKQAGAAHDLGKHDPRFQIMLHGSPDPVLAKSPEAINHSNYHEDGAYPRGARHELLSLAVCVAAGAEDLLCHLVASHHGYCRPFAPVIDDKCEGAIEITWQEHRYSVTLAQHYHRLGSGVVDRFWTCTHRYGWWGLAYLESLVRLADHRISECRRTLK